MTDSEILMLVDRLERCLLSATEFHHRDHLTVAAIYLYASEFTAALDKMRSSLCRFAAHHGSTLYHETLTRFWMTQVEKHLDRSLCLAEAVERVHGALPDKGLVDEYYSPGLLRSAEAKAGWIEPDLQEIGLVCESQHAIKEPDHIFPDQVVNRYSYQRSEGKIPIWDVNDSEIHEAPAGEFKEAK
jgi:hypothetical protein